MIKELMASAASASSPPAQPPGLCCEDHPTEVAVFTVDKGLHQWRGSCSSTLVATKDEAREGEAASFFPEKLMVMFPFPPQHLFHLRPGGHGRDCGSGTCFLFMQLKGAQLILIVETISLMLKLFP